MTLAMLVIFARNNWLLYHSPGFHNIDKKMC